MATQTTYYNLVKPAASEAIDVSQMNGNMDIIDGAMNGIQTGLNNTVRFVSQELTDNQKLQARSNIGALDDSSVTDVLRYSAQTLTDEQKTQARTNIGAAADADVVKVTTQSLTTAEQGQARTNIGLDNLFLRADYTADITIGASNNINVNKEDLNIVDIEGYTILGIRRAWVTKTACVVSRFSATGTAVSGQGDVIVSVKNTSSSEQSLSVGVTLIWVKRDLVSVVS